jgi:hypothetical protein
MIGCLDFFQVQLEFFMFDDIMFDDMVYPAIIQGPEFSSEMQCYFSRLLVLFLATVLQQFTVTVGLCQTASPCPSGVRRPKITQMQHRMPVARAFAQAVGFTCRNRNNIFDSRRSMECLRCHVTSQGTPCADPSSYKSLSFTGRADTSTGTLLEHAGTLGAFSNCCPRCVLPTVTVK